MIPAAPPTPERTDSANFPAKADAFVAWMADDLVPAFNADIAALNFASTNDTSTSSVAISAGTKSFTVSTSKSYVAGMWLLMADAAAPGANSMVGQVTSYSGTSLVVEVEAAGVKGSGTKTSWVISLTAMPAGAGIKQLQSIDYSLSGNALTLKLNPTNLDFRSTTLTTGAPTNITNASQLTTTISSGSTGGTVSAVQSDIIILAINNAGTMELAWTNAAGGVNLDEQGVITTVAEGGAGAADSATTIYSTTARTGVSYRVVGLFRSTQTTAGTWAQTPTLVQGIGGRALANSSAPIWSAYTGGGQSITNATLTKLLMNVEDYDPNNIYDPTTNYRATLSVAGYYSTKGMMALNANGTGFAILLLYKNGAEVRRGAQVPCGATQVYVNFAADIYLNAGDYLEMYVYQTTGATQTTLSNASNNGYFQGSFIRS
jgi:hypothetical protein